MIMNLNYNAFSSVALLANFIDSSSGTPVDILFNCAAGTPLTSSTGSGIVKFSVFNTGTTGVATSTLNGSPFPLSGLYMNALSTSGNMAYYNISEGLSANANGTGYDVRGYYAKRNASGVTIQEQTVGYTFYVYPQGNNLDPRLN